MSASFAIREFARALFPRRCRNEILVVLAAYFDDSGTHDNSAVVVMGGLIADETQWESFEEAWGARLLEPVEGRGPIQRFHMHDCEMGRDEFEGWNRAERDRTIFNFRQIILDHKPIGYTCAIARKPWDAYIRGSLRAGLGDAEQHCVISCFIQSLSLARAHYPAEKKIALVFDNRPHREAANKRVFEIYQRNFKIQRELPEPTGVAFLSSLSALPLQGADMVAWESYRYAQTWLKDGPKAKRRPHFERLIEAGRFNAQIADSPSIRRIAKHVTGRPSVLRALGEFMTHGKLGIDEVFPLPSGGPPS